MTDQEKEAWRKLLGITEDETTDENDVEGEWEYVRGIRSGNGRTKADGAADH